MHWAWKYTTHRLGIYVDVGPALITCQLAACHFIASWPVTGATGQQYGTEIAEPSIKGQHRSPREYKPYMQLSTLEWRHNEPDVVSNHRLLNRLLRRRSNKTLKLRVTSLRGGNSPVTGEFSTQRASNAENVSIWWLHHQNNVYTEIDLYCDDDDVTWWSGRLKPLTTRWRFIFTF